MGYLKIEEKGRVIFDSRGIDFTLYKQKEFKQGDEPEQNHNIIKQHDSVESTLTPDADWAECFAFGVTESDVFR